MSKKETEDMSMAEFMKGLGIVPGRSTQFSKPCYKIKVVERATIDRSKFPMTKAKYIDTKLYFTYKEALKVCKKMEKEDPKNIYSPQMTFLVESEWKKLFGKKSE